MARIEKIVIVIALVAAHLVGFLGTSRIFSSLSSMNEVNNMNVSNVPQLLFSSMSRIVTENTDTAARNSIPRILWFTYKYDILQRKTPEVLYNNIMKSIDAYRQLWRNDSNMVVNFLVDSNCTDLLEEVDRELNLTLTKTFREEPDGSFKSDLCRLAALYLHGGYYFDIDMEVIQPVLLDDDVSFSTALSIQKRYPGI
jgi:mannosyltransferase OCH1-like enzyme